MTEFKRFAKIRLIESLAMVITFVILLWITNDYYWPTRPDDPLVIVAGSLYIVILFYIFFGYIASSAVGFLASGLIGKWRSVWIGIAGALVFAVHSSLVVRTFRIQLGFLSVAIWFGFVLLNVALPFVFGRPPRQEP
jgi:hypothetical protein